jgi:tetratricopeptide (TPR) repeat protein
VNRGYALMQLKQYREAISSFNHALRIYPDYCTAWINKGVSHCLAGEYEKAVTCLNRAEGICPVNPRNLYWKGLALSRLGKYREGLDCLSKAISHDPHNADAWVVMSNCHFMLGNLEESGHSFMIAYGIDKRDITDLVSKGISLMRQGNRREALECMSGVFGILLR